MGIATPSATNRAVHIEIPHFHALYEGAVNWSACGPVANEVALACLDGFQNGRMPDVGNAKAVMAADIAAGRFTPHQGQDLADILWDIQRRGYHQVETIPYSGAPDTTALHAFVKRGALAQFPVIIEVSHAYNLPDNEAGVNYHFVVIGGIDSALGYLIANGDTQTAIRQGGNWPPLNWATWAQLVAAGVCGAIMVKPMNWQPAPPVAPPDDEAAEAAKVAALQAQFAQVESSVAAFATALRAL